MGICVGVSLSAVWTPPQPWVFYRSLYRYRCRAVWTHHKWQSFKQKIKRVNLTWFGWPGDVVDTRPAVDPRVHGNWWRYYDNPSTPDPASPPGTWAPRDTRAASVGVAPAPSSPSPPVTYWNKKVTLVVAFAFLSQHFGKMARYANDILPVCECSWRS